MSKHVLDMGESPKHRVRLLPPRCLPVILEPAFSCPAWVASTLIRPLGDINSSPVPRPPPYACICSERCPSMSAIEVRWYLSCFHSLTAACRKQCAVTAFRFGGQSWSTSAQIVEVGDAAEAGNTIDFPSANRSASRAYHRLPCGTFNTRRSRSAFASTFASVIAICTSPDDTRSAQIPREDSLGLPFDFMASATGGDWEDQRAERPPTCAIHVRLRCFCQFEFALAVLSCVVPLQPDQSV